MYKVIRLMFIGDRTSFECFTYAFKMEAWSHKDETDALKIANLIFEGDTAREWVLTEMIGLTCRAMGITS
jgi:hypothetical protein